MQKYGFLWLIVIAGGLGAALAAGMAMYSHRPGSAQAAPCTNPNVFQIELKPPFPHRHGLMYEASVGSDSWRTPTFLKHPMLRNMRLGPGNTAEEPRRSTAIVCEDDYRLGPPHSAGDEISELGRGRYAHYSGLGILFSTSDGTNPNTNGRRYRAIEP